jgi:hypothetical protein
LNLKNEWCSVEILTDTTYSVQSCDNRHYDLELNPQHYSHNDCYKAFSIHIDLFNHKIDITLVGDFYSNDSDCAILDGKVLTIMQNNTISQICVEHGTLMRHKEFECLGCTLGLHRVVNGYIVYGEIEIIMLDLNFDKVWEFCGKNIFISQTREHAFALGENAIQLYDWEDNYYEIDYTGKLIRAQMKK